MASQPLRYTDLELGDIGASILRSRYSYRFSFWGLPIIQIPTDLVALQEIIFAVRPSVIVELGIAHGGLLVYNAAMLALLDTEADPTPPLPSPHPQANRRVIGVDVEIKAHNREAIRVHPMSSRIELIEGSSTDSDVISRVKALINPKQRVMVLLDSNHTHAHVLAELEAYAPLVSVGSYCIVFDTIIQDMPAGSFPDRPWDKGNNPKTAVWEFLESHPEFEIDTSIPEKLLITVAPDGYLKRVS
jgi:cephalosporin hydroxylase